ISLYGRMLMSETTDVNGQMKEFLSKSIDHYSADPNDLEKRMEIANRIIAIYQNQGWAIEDIFTVLKWYKKHDESLLDGSATFCLISDREFVYEARYSRHESLWTVRN